MCLDFIIRNNLETELNVFFVFFFVIYICKMQTRTKKEKNDLILDDSGQKRAKTLWLPFQFQKFMSTPILTVFVKVKFKYEWNMNQNQIFKKQKDFSGECSLMPQINLITFSFACTWYERMKVKFNFLFNFIVFVFYIIHFSFIYKILWYTMETPCHAQ